MDMTRTHDPEAVPWQKRTWEDWEQIHHPSPTKKERAESLAFLKVLRLAPTLEVAEAMVKGQQVPTSRLDPEWARAYGLVP